MSFQINSMITPKIHTHHFLLNNQLIPILLLPMQKSDYTEKVPNKSCKARYQLQQTRYVKLDPGEIIFHTFILAASWVDFPCKFTNLLQQWAFLYYSLPGGTKITGKLLHIKMKYMLYFSISKHLKKIGYESYWHSKIVGCAK